LRESRSNRYRSGSVDSINLESDKKEDNRKKIKKKFHKCRMTQFTVDQGAIMGVAPGKSY
jgi:hypothetical protein